MDLLDYIKWRGDLSFEERELNEVDSLIFCSLSYESFDDIFRLKKSMTVNELAKIFFALYDEEELKKRIAFSNRSFEFIKAMRNTKRYQSLILSHYVNEIDHESDLQFSALTIEYPKKWKYIVFRGTDDTFTGWKEDFSMLYKEEVLSQRKAVEYIQQVYKETKDDHRFFHKYDYYLAGHSKGGNLAMYAGLCAQQSLQKRIKKIYNFDGPGFNQEVWEKESMKQMKEKIVSYIPTDCFFGRLFEHQEKTMIIKSLQTGLLQHSAYNWVVDVDHFQYENQLSEKSNQVIIKFNTLMNSIDKKEREEMIENIFTIFPSLNIYTFTDITKIHFNSVLKLLKEWNGFDNKSKKLLIELLGLVWEIFQ